MFKTLFGKKKNGISPEDFEFVDHETDADNSAFLASLETMTPDDIAPEQPGERPTLADRLFNTVRTVLLIGCAGVFAYCLYSLGESVVGYFKADELYTTISEDFFSDGASSAYGANSGMLSKMQKSTQGVSIPTFSEILSDASQAGGAGESVTAGKTYNLEFERRRAKLEELAARNSDTYGYIKVDGTKINCVVMQSEDNDFYLEHDINGDYLKSGAIFADYRCEKSPLDNKNTILYGHNMNNGSMFNGVLDFLNKDVFESTQIVFYSFDGIYTYEVFSIFPTKSNYDYFRTYFETGADFVEFCEQMQKNSKYSKNMTFTEDDRIITLSTCNNATSNGRYALHAKLISVEN